MIQYDNTTIARNVLANALIEFSSEEKDDVLQWLTEFDSVAFWCTIADVNMNWYLSVFRHLSKANKSVRSALAHQVKVSMLKLPVSYTATR